MPFTRLRRLIGPLYLFEAVLANRLQHRVAHCPVGMDDLTNQAVIEEPGVTVKDVHGSTDGRSRLQCPATDEG